MKLNLSGMLRYATGIVGSCYWPLKPTQPVIAAIVDVRHGKVAHGEARLLCRARYDLLQA